MEKYLKPVILGLILLLIGIVCFYIETIKYDISVDMTSNFLIKQKITKHQINDNITYRFTNDNTNKNINVYIDNTLKDDIRVVVEYADMLEIDYDYDDTKFTKKELISIDIESDLELDFDNMKELYKMALSGLKNKTIYNYTLLKYPKVKIYVNEKYKNNIKLVDKYGKEYNQIG